MLTRSHAPVSTVAALALAMCVSVACAESAPAGLGASEVTLSADTVTGSGSLAELQQRRSGWVARNIDDYRYRLQIVCFCAGDVTRPVLVEVRDGAVARALDLETGRAMADLSPYRTITALFDAAIAERSGGGYVSVAYDRVLGFPARLEVGTLANDAGVLYLLADLRAL